MANWHKCAKLAVVFAILVCQHDASYKFWGLALITADRVISRLCGAPACSLKLCYHSCLFFSGLRRRLRQDPWEWQLTAALWPTYKLVEI